jgi:hypothetical protein
MQELQQPWTHWFSGGRSSTQSGVLLEDFVSAHEKEDTYGGVQIRGLFEGGGNAGGLEGFIERAGFKRQPNEFSSAEIGTEVDGSPDGSSPTWEQLYRNAINGLAIPVPFRRVRATDVEVQARAAAAYAAFIDPEKPSGQIPDISALLTDEAERAMSIRPRLGATGREILVQMCQGCHSSRLDQTISRAKFNVERLDEMSQDEKQLAIDRMFLPSSSRLKMPPPIESELSYEERLLVAGELNP